MGKKHKRFLNMVALVAQDVVPVASARISAGIVIKSRMISLGSCSYKTHPFQKTYGKNSDSICLHAEIDAIKNALRRVSVEDLKRATLYVARMKKEVVNNLTLTYRDVWGNSRPCIGCQKAIATFGINKVYYTTDIHNKYECL